MALPIDKFSVTFDVPKHIVRGLETGVYERLGGVVRHATRPGNPQGGQVVAWLRESPQLAELAQTSPEGAQALPAEALSQLQSIGAGMNALIGLQALTLGVTVAGFAVIAAQLRSLDRKLDLVLREVRDLGEEISWLVKRADLEVLALISSAVETARIAEAALPPSDAVREFRYARRELTNARVQLAALTGLLIGEKRIWEQPQALPVYARLFLSAVTAEVRISLLLHHNGAAIEATRAGHATVEDILTAYQGRLGTPLSAILEGRPANLDAARILGEGKALFQDTILRLEGHRSEVEYLSACGMPVEEWEALSAGAEGATLVCIEPTKSASTG